jgi:hypothetical protein
MKAEELIVGHFDSSLTKAQESELQRMLAGSSEARALYDRHASIHAMLLQDAAVLAPSAALDETVIGAALAAPVEIAGGGAAGIGFGAKVAAVVSTFAVGGLALVMMTTPTSEQRTPAASGTPVPAVRTAPRSTPSTPAPSRPESTASGQVARDEQTGAPVNAQQSAIEATRPAAKKTQHAARKGTADQQPTLTLPTDATVINHPLKVDNGGDKK